jgi:hypothetical protein
MYLQAHIDSVIFGHHDKKETLRLLWEILSDNKNVLFCDFDDTLITPGISTEAYYLGYTHTNFFKPHWRLLHVSLSQTFLGNIPSGTRDIIILTRNFLPLVQELVQALQKEFKQNGLCVVGIIGKVPKTSLTRLTSRDKLILLPPRGVLVTDIFEHDALSGDARCMFLPPPIRGPRWIVCWWHWWIKVRDYFRGMVSVFFWK